MYAEQFRPSIRPSVCHIRANRIVEIHFCFRTSTANV